MLCLNHEEGGELTTQLHSLYVFLIKEVSRAGFEGNPARLPTPFVWENLYNGFQVALARTMMVKTSMISFISLRPFVQR